MRYRCSFPDCPYETEDRDAIDLHHVIPKEIDPSPRNKRTIPFCKTHHSLIFVPKSNKGQHSRKHNESLIINSVLDSSDGKVIVFEDIYGREILWSLKTYSLF